MSINAEFVERCQLEYLKNPTSKVFAPLGEAYRQMGLLEEAHRVCKLGVQIHPNFASGRVAYAKVLLAMKQPLEALEQLEKATQLSPENLLAHHLMGETLIELRRPKEALRAFKMILLHNPADLRAQQNVKKWEFLTADEYDAEVFKVPKKAVHKDETGDGTRERALERSAFQKSDSPMRRSDRNSAENSASTEPKNDEPESDGIEELLLEDDESAAEFSTDDSAHKQNQAGAPSDTMSNRAPDMRLALAQRHARALERAISLADALTVRNDLEAAIRILTDAKRLLGPMPEIENRFNLIQRRLNFFSSSNSFDSSDSSSQPSENWARPGDTRFSAAGGEDNGASEREHQAQVLRTFLQRIEERRADRLR